MYVLIQSNMKANKSAINDNPQYTDTLGSKHISSAALEKRCTCKIALEAPVTRSEGGWGCVQVYRCVVSARQFDLVHYKPGILHDWFVSELLA